MADKNESLNFQTGIGPVLMVGVLTAKVVSLFTPANLSSVVIFSAIGSLWSLKNVTIGPLKEDLGIVTNTLVCAAYCYENKSYQVAATALLCAHYGAAAFLFIPPKSTAISKKLKKSVEFVNFLKGYIGGTLIYWGVITYVRSQEDGVVGGFPKF